MSDVVDRSTAAIESRLTKAEMERDQYLAEKLKLFHTCNAVEEQRNEALNMAATLKAAVDMLQAQVNVMAQKIVHLEDLLRAHREPKKEPVGQSETPLVRETVKLN